MACRILLLTVALLWAQPLAAQPQAADPIRELLVEVRLLRRTLERAATTGARIQLLVGRVQLQEQRISDVSRTLDGARSELRDLDRGIDALGRQLTSFEETAANSVDAAERRAAEQQAALVKGQLSGMERRRQELLAEEAFLSQQLTGEQNRWAELNERLEQLERSLQDGAR